MWPVGMWLVTSRRRRDTESVWRPGLRVRNMLIRGHPPTHDRISRPGGSLRSGSATARRSCRGRSPRRCRPRQDRAHGAPGDPHQLGHRGIRALNRQPSHRLIEGRPWPAATTLPGVVPRRPPPTPRAPSCVSPCGDVRVRYHASSPNSTATTTVCSAFEQAAP